MPNEIWGVGGLEGTNWPDGPLAVGLLLMAVGLVIWALVRSDAPTVLRAMTRSQWAMFVALCGASLLLSGLLPVALPWADPLLRGHPATGVVALFSAAPYLLAGAALGTPAAILVGLCAGIGRALGQTGAPIDAAAVALAAGLSAVLLRGNYAGRLFDALRRPVVAGMLGRLVIAAFVALDVLARSSGTNFFGALDLALFLSFWSIIPLLIEGLVGGAIVSAALWIAPQWRPDRGRVPSPFQRSLQRQLVITFLAFAAVVVLLSALVAFYFSARSAERALVEQMVGNVDATAARLVALQENLAVAAADVNGETTDPAIKSEALGRLGASAEFSDFRLIDATGVVTTGPATGGRPAAALSAAERAIAEAALNDGAIHWLAEDSGEEPVITMAAPQAMAAGDRFALLARVTPAALAAILDGLTGSGGRGYGLIVDENGRALLTTSDGISAAEWTPPPADRQAQRVSQTTGHTIYAANGPGGARQLIYVSPPAAGGWRVVGIVPQAAVLRETLGIIGPLAALLLAISAVFYGVVAALGRGIARPIAEMRQVSRAIAVGGGLERPVRPGREDEIGQLTLAFSQMQRALRQRLDELSLLLSVSNEVAATIHIDEGMAAVLQGVLRGTGAAGARAIVRNPSAPTPLVFAEGPWADSLAPLDRAVLLRLRAADELIFGSAADIQEELGAKTGAAALFALPLRPAGDFQGVLYLAYRQPHYFDDDERSLLHTLAGQATVLVQNAHLFAAAESGRRRLAAILASTTNGVIVTDQTERVVLLNPAMERAFGLRARTDTGRPVADVLAGSEAAEALSRRLSPNGATGGELELEAGGRTFLAAVSTVQSSEGQTMGRVAVLQDVTELKELDRLKSEFVAGVSHDLLSPLTYMHNYAAMLPIVDDPALEREYADKILGGIERMKRLVNDLLDLARIEAGLNLQVDRVQVDELLAEVAQEYAAPAKAAGVQLLVEVEDETPSAAADPALLRRAVTNLVTNAFKYAPDSGPVTLRAEAVGEEIVISVRDRGPGIVPADQARLFEKFYRGGETTAARGSGLGLAIVKSVADLHGGRAWCESTVGGGSVFYLAIPRVYSS